MYLDYYGLKKLPFSIASSPEFFFASASHEEALAALLYGINERKGIMLLTGEVGTGKTTVCKSLLERLSGSAKTSLILNPYFNPAQLLCAILEDFGVKPKNNNRLTLLNQLNRFLIESNAQNCPAVLVVDEAQNLTARQLEQIRILTNLETSWHKLLQVVISGQPELDEKLRKHSLRQLKQRVSIRCCLRSLNQKEISHYINHRLKKAGKKKVIIAQESLPIIYEFSQGIPRLINMLCDRAMLCGFARSTHNLDAKVFTDCVKELA